MARDTSGNFLRNITGPGGREFLEAKKKVKEAYSQGGAPSAIGIGLRETPGVLAATARDIITPEPLRRGLSTLATGVGEVGRAAITGKPTSTPTILGEQPDLAPTPRTDTGPIMMTNEGITGDVQGAREQIQRNRQQQFGLSDQYKQGPSGSYDVGGLDVKFDPGTDPEAARRFLRDPVGGGARARNIAAPRQLREMRSTVSELPSKEGMSRHQYQQLLENKGALDVQQERNLGSLAEQSLRGESALAAQGMRNEQEMAAQEIQQNKAQSKNIQDIKERNVSRLKDRNALYQERLKNFMGSPEEYAQLEAEANKAATEYERILGSGTVGTANEQAQKYLQ